MPGIIIFQVFKKARKHHKKLDIYHYNLLLRCIKECGFGDPKLDVQLLQDQDPSKIPSKSADGLATVKEQPWQEVFDQSHTDMLVLKPGPEAEESVQNSGERITDGSQASSLPEVKIEPPTLFSLLNSSNCIVDMHELRTPEERFKLLGGLHGFLDQIKKDRASANIATFTLMLDLIPSNSSAEEELIAEMNSYGVRPEITFFNLVIRKRNLRRDWFGVKVIKKISEVAI